MHTAHCFNAWVVGHFIVQVMSNNSRSLWHRVMIPCRGTMVNTLSFMVILYLWRCPPTGLQKTSGTDYLVETLHGMGRNLPAWSVTGLRNENQWCCLDKKSLKPHFLLFLLWLVLANQIHDRQLSLSCDIICCLSVLLNDWISCCKRLTFLINQFFFW